MPQQVQNQAEVPQATAGPHRERILLFDPKLLNWSGIVFALLQSACTAVIAISGVRVAIGVSALAAAAGIHAPAHGFHQDAIRIPMMTLAFLGDRKSTRLNSSHSQISYAVFCLKKKKRG